MKHEALCTEHTREQLQSLELGDWRRLALNLPIRERAQGGDQSPMASIARVRASKSEP